MPTNPPLTSQVLLQRYAGVAPFPALSYATVRDFCDSVDAFPDLAKHQNDLKDAERPWAVKAILNRVRPGAQLLEIGSGEPLAAATLASLGYKVTICDPFDGSGNGPTQYASYKSQYPAVKFIRSLFTPEVARTMKREIDCVFSISVLEHVVGEHLTKAFEATAIALKVGGHSIHAVDHVLQGRGDDWHSAQLLEILKHQACLAGAPANEQLLSHEMRTLFQSAQNDLETFFLSPQGHNLWRGVKTYDTFPFRKCIAVQTIVCRSIDVGRQIA